MVFNSINNGVNRNTLKTHLSVFDGVLNLSLITVTYQRSYTRATPESIAA
jgi:hypothetical protein